MDRIMSVYYMGRYVYDAMFVDIEQPITKVADLKYVSKDGTYEYYDFGGYNESSSYYPSDLGILIFK